MLGKLGPKAAVVMPDLIAQVNRLKGTEFERLQEAVIEAIGEMGSVGRTALPSLARATGRSLDLDQAIKRSTRDILTGPDKQDLELLLIQSRSLDPSLRLRAAKALAGLGPDVYLRALPFLENLLTDPDGDVRRTAIQTLRSLNPKGPVPESVVKALTLDLKDRDAEIRLQALRALGNLGKPAATVSAQVEALLADPDQDVRKTAVQTMQKILVP
jgi:HEAT repeat protein